MHFRAHCTLVVNRSFARKSITQDLTPLFPCAVVLILPSLSPNFRFFKRLSRPDTPLSMRGGAYFAVLVAEFQIFQAPVST
jgi:hypothetical protein